MAKNGTMTADDVRREIARQAEDLGSVTAWAKAKKLSQAYVAHVLQGRQEPGKKMLAALGVRRVVKYERVRA
jgi:hypothetical protein